MMLRNLKFLLLGFLVIAIHACKDAKQTEIPVSDFFKSSEKSSFKISPDGKYISYLKSGKKQKKELFIRSLSDGKERFATTINNWFPGWDYWWSYDNQVIFIQYNGLTNENKIFALDGATLKVRTLLSEKDVQIQVVLNRNKKQPDIVILAMNKPDPTRLDVYKLNTKTGELTSYLINPGFVKEWLPDRDGKIQLAKSSDGIDETIYFRPNDNAQFKAIIKSNFKNSVYPVAYSFVKNSFYARSNVNRDKTALVEINAETGKERLIFSSDKADISRVDYSRNKQRLELVSWEAGKPQKHFLNGDAESIYKNISSQLKGYEVNIGERDSAENKFIVDTYTDRNRGAVYLYEKKGNKLTSLTNKSTLNPEELCEVKPISYTASDGLLINGYLTLPKGGTTNLPVVVMPHDANFGQFGPGRRERDSWRYNEGVQFLANRGYAVLQINYRGSGGYGKAFYEAGFKELGGKIQQDITDGVHWLIEKKIANPKKIAMMGRGFGGYSGYYGAMNHPELYNCIIVQNGVINYLAYIKDVPQFLKSSISRMYEMIGDPEKDLAKFTEISPRFHTDKIKTPLLIFQDMQDFRANIPELMLFISDLKRRNVPLTYKEIKREGPMTGPMNGGPITGGPLTRGLQSGDPKTVKPNMPIQANDWWMKANQANIDMYTEVQKFLDLNMGVKR